MYVEEKDTLERMEWKYWNVSCCWGALRNSSQIGEKVMSQLLLDCLCCVYGWGTLERMNTKEEETISGPSGSIIADFQLLICIKTWLQCVCDNCHGQRMSVVG